MEHYSTPCKHHWNIVTDNANALLCRTQKVWLGWITTGTQTNLASDI